MGVEKIVLEVRKRIAVSVDENELQPGEVVLGQSGMLDPPRLTTP